MTHPHSDRLSRLFDYLTQDPHNVRLLADIAQEQMSIGDLSAAENSLQQALEKSPGDPQTTYLQAVLKRLRGKSEQALELLHDLAKGLASIRKVTTSSAHRPNGERKP